jgi:bis(5'-nucleosidyl)-tetraphosphatase
VDLGSGNPLGTLSAGVIVLRRTAEGSRYLLLRAYRYWDFPKGIVEAGEDPLAAAVREVEEETGIRELEFAWGHVFHETAPYGSGKVARYYLALTPASQVLLPVSPELGKPEHDEFRWVSYSEAMQLLNERLRQALAWAHGLISLLPPHSTV